MPISVTDIDQDLTVAEDHTVSLNDIVITDDGDREFTVRLTLSDPTAGVIFLDDDPDTIHALVGSATVLNTLLASARFVPAANWNGETSIQVLVEAGGESQAGVIALDVTAVNDAPVVTAPAAISIPQGAATELTGVSFSDVDAGAASVTATFSVSQGELSATSGAGVTVDGDPTALTLKGSIADINAYIASGQVVYSPGSDVMSRSLTVTIDDGGATGGPALSDSQFVNLQIDVNLPPSVSVPPSIGVIEDVPTALTGISVNDADGDSLTVTINASAGGIAAQNAAGVTIGDVDGRITLTGSSADINAYFAAGHLTYIPDPDDTTDRLLTLEVYDGQSITTETIDLAITAVNDAPTITAPGSISALAGAATAIRGLVFDDVDAGSGDVTVSLSLSNSLLSGLAVFPDSTVDPAVNDGVVTLTGTLAELNAFIEAGKVALSAPLGMTADVILNVTIDDLGNTGAGAARTATTSVTLEVSDGNTPPTGFVDIQGLAQQGETLLGTFDIDDLDGVGEVSLQWRADGEDIAGATGDTLVLTQDEVGKDITLVASYEDGDGKLESMASVATAAVANVNDAPTGGVTISGLAQVGRTLTANTSTLGDLDGLGDLAYEWRVDGEYVGDENSLVLHEDMLGKAITVSVSYEDGYGESESVDSAAVTVAAPPSPEPEPSRTTETRTIGDRTFVIETVIGADGVPRKTITAAPNDNPAAPPAQLDLVTPANQLMLGLPSGFGLIASGPTLQVDLSELIAGANPAIVRAILESRQAIEAENQAYIQQLQFSMGQFQDVPDPITLMGGLDGYMALMISTIQAATLQVPTIDLSHIDLALISGRANLIGGAGPQLVFGDDDQQSMILGEGDDELHGGGGADTVGSQGGNDSLFGDDGDDTVFGGEGGDQLFGGADADTVQGNTGNDFVQGNQGDDLLYGGQGDDVVRGGQGSDLVFGDLGDDLVFGDLGNDTLYGGDGADTLSGGQGDDVLTGGGGADVFLISAANGQDRITDFTAADHVVLAQGVGFSLRQEGADTVVDLGDEGRVVLTGVQLDLLPEHWLTVA